MVIADGVAKGADAYFTHSALGMRRLIPEQCRILEDGSTSCTAAYYVGVKETDPIARPFVKTTAGQVAYFAGTWAADTGLAYMLHRAGHYKMEKFVLTTGIGYSAFGAAHSAHVAFTF